MDIPDLTKRLRSGVIEWCRITHQGHVTDDAPYEAADALEKLSKAVDRVWELAKENEEQQAEIERLKKQADCGHSDLPQECHSCGWRVRLGG